MKNNRRRGPDILLERYRLGELDAEKSARIEERLRDDPDLRRSLKELEQSDHEILTRYRPEETARRITARLAEQRGQNRRRLPVFGLATAAAGAFAVLFFVLVAPGPRNGETLATKPVEVVRAKGDPASPEPTLSIFRLGPSGPESLTDGTTVFTRDTVQVQYEISGTWYGVILSLDGRGAVTPHYPLSPSETAALKPGRVLLENAFELDNVPDFEKFYFITAAAEFDPSLVFEAARRLARSGKPVRDADLKLPARFTQTSFLLLKEKR
jgi:hypothetical protein